MRCRRPDGGGAARYRAIASPWLRWFRRRFRRWQLPWHHHACADATCCPDHGTYPPAENTTGFASRPSIVLACLRTDRAVLNGRVAVDVILLSVAEILMLAPESAEWSVVDLAFPLRNATLCAGLLETRL